MLTSTFNVQTNCQIHPTYVWFQTCMRRKGIKDSDPYDWERPSTDHNTNTASLSSVPAVKQTQPQQPGWGYIPFLFISWNLCATRKRSARVTNWKKKVLHPNLFFRPCECSEKTSQILKVTEKICVHFWKSIDYILCAYKCKTRLLTYQPIKFWGYIICCIAHVA